MVIVTGAGGFIGHYIADEVERLKPVLRTGMGSRWNNKPLPFLDVRNPGDFKKLPKIPPEAVIHCAGLLMINNHRPKDYFLTNALGTYNVLEYCRETGARLIYLQTHSDMNASPKTIITEEDPRCFIGQTPNAAAFIASKIAACEMIEAYNRAKMVQGIILRVANVRGFGSQDTNYNSVFHQFIKKAQNAEAIELWGKRETVRDLIYVKDVARAAKMCLDRDGISGIYNIGSGEGLTIEDEARAIQEVFSPRGEWQKIIYRDDIEEVRTHSCIFSITKARTEIAWQPIYSYIEGLRDMKAEMESAEGREDKSWQ